jgi:monoamine oxidase
MPSPTHAEVIIVGGGLSGLQSAVTLHEAKIPFLVLEARPRIGGKTLSRDFSNAISDMGAAWINSTNQSHMYALAKRFNLETIEQNTNGDIVMHDLDGSVHSFPYGQIPGQEVEAGGVENMVKIRDLFETLCQKVDVEDLLSSVKTLGIDYDKMSMADFVRYHKGGETACCTVSIWTRAMLGLEPEEVSALFFLGYCKAGGGIMQMRSDRKDGGQFLRIAKGWFDVLASLMVSKSEVNLTSVFRDTIILPWPSISPPSRVHMSELIRVGNRHQGFPHYHNDNIWHEVHLQ